MTTITPDNPLVRTKELPLAEADFRRWLKRNTRNLEVTVEKEQIRLRLVSSSHEVLFMGPEGVGPVIYIKTFVREAGHVLVEAGCQHPAFLKYFDELWTLLTGPQETRKARDPGGRPGEPEDEWARIELHVRNQGRDRVFDDWCKLVNARREPRFPLGTDLTDMFRLRVQNWKHKNKFTVLNQV